MELFKIGMQPGDIVFWKEYGFFKTLWAKLTGKELRYNRSRVFVDAPLWHTTTVKALDKAVKLIRLRKPYSKKEVLRLQLATKLYGEVFDCDSQEVKELYALLNHVRPCTFDELYADVDMLTASKYYKPVMLEAIVQKHTSTDSK